MEKTNEVMLRPGTVVQKGDEEWQVPEGVHIPARETGMKNFWQLGKPLRKDIFSGEKTPEVASPQSPVYISQAEIEKLRQEEGGKKEPPPLKQAKLEGF